MNVRAGIGFDAHRFSDGGKLMLGGVEIDHPRGLEGHSDGDVVSHAVVDAILGAARAGDIGTHFGSSDERWRGASSRMFLERAAALIADAGYRIENVDVTVICEAPRIDAYREKMEASIAASLGTGSECVSVKATTTDAMGFTGRGEGIAAFAVAMLSHTGTSETR